MSERLDPRSLPAFTAAAEALVDEIMAAVDEPSRDAVAAAIDAGATLRLAVNVAPRLELVLYLVTAETPPRSVTIARYGVGAQQGAADSAPIGLPH